jgi:salicylate hydroxylase
VSVFVGPGRHCLWYPVSADRYSVAAVVPEPLASPLTGRPADPAADPVGSFAGWHPDVTAVLAAADGFTRSSLHERDPLARWNSGRITVVGDAAHPMLPFAAQGANQAIESAVTLGACLLAADGPEEALERYAALRRPRLERVAALVRRNAGGLHVADGAAQGRRDRVLAEAGDYGWLFGHDAEATLTRTAIGAGAAG